MNYKIGIPGWSLGDNSFGAGKAYMEYLSKFGDVIILPPTPTIFDLDLLVMPGGQDLMSDKYGEAPSFLNSNPDVYKEYFFNNNLSKYIDNGTPIFGICLGFQMLNVFFKGSLTQNVWHPYSEKERGELVHKCDFEQPYLPLRKELEIKKDFEVNSLHHQGVQKEQLAKCLNPILSWDGIVEAFEHQENDIAAVQWHPEEIYDVISTHLVEKLIENGRTNRKIARKPEDLIKA